MIVLDFMSRRLAPAHGPEHGFRLQGGVADAEALRQQGMAGFKDALPAGDVLHHQMSGEQGFPRLDLPDVQVVYRGDAGHARQRLADFLRHDVERRALHQSVQRFAQQTQTGNQNQRANQQ
jgi:hypothetical protein